MDNNVQDFMDSMNAWGWSVNARINFNKFIDAIETEQGLSEQIQRIQSIIDDIVLNKEISQFKKCLEVGTEYYRARIINPEDDNDLEKGIGKTQDNKFMGYDEINSREPILGIGSEGRNNIAGASYLYIASNPETACMEIKSQFGCGFETDCKFITKRQMKKSRKEVKAGNKILYSKTTQKIAEPK